MSRYQLDMEVRDYECDMADGVNNSIYMSYLEHARHKYLASIGINFAEFARAKIGLIVIRAELDCGFNRSMQHTRICVSRRSVADEIQDTDSLHGCPKSSDVGALAGWRFSPADRPVV